MAPTILIVEDEPLVCETIELILSDRGFDVLTAGDGARALRLVAEQPVDLLFTDVTMPGMNGFELAAEAKRLRPALRVLFMSGYDEKTEANGGKLIRKPLHAKDVLMEINEALSN